MRQLLGDPQRLAHVQLNVRSRHIGDLAPHPFKVQCAAKQTSRQGTNAKLRDFRLFPQNAEKLDRRSIALIRS
jgi:hypothetical protein